MEPNDLPIVCIPLELPDQAAADLLEFLQNLTEILEQHYFSQLQRRYSGGSCLPKIAFTIRSS